MDKIKIVSLNAKGLNIPEKRRMMLKDMRRLKEDVVLLQETHFRENTFPILKNRYFPIVYNSTNSEAKSRGVSILILAKLPCSLTDVRSDLLGRFLFNKGQIGGIGVTIANLYAPNIQQETFVKKHLTILRKFSEGQLIVGGDLNTPLHPEVDTLTGRSATTRGMRKAIHLALHSSQLIDVWRLFHHGERDYSFFSRSHNVYTPIDYFLLPHNQLHAVKDASLGSIMWSDHAPVTLTYALADLYRSQKKLWRLNESLLQSPEVLTDVTREINNYFQTNNDTDCDAGLVWEAHKAVIHGTFIKHGARIKKQRTAQLTLLLNKLQDLEIRHKQTPTNLIGNELDAIRTQVTDLLNFKAKAALHSCVRKSLNRVINVVNYWHNPYVPKHWHPIYRLFTPRQVKM